MPRGRYLLSAVGAKLPGASQSNRVSLQAVAKGSIGGNYCVPNELICAEIGRFLYLPIPPGGIISGTEQGRIATEGDIYASLDFNLAGDDLPPVDTERCAKLLPDESTGLILFDIIIANSDRHANNFSVDFEAKPPAMAVFDHSHALFGYQPAQGVTRLQNMRDRLAISGGALTMGNRHCLLDKLETSEYFDKWVRRVEALPDFYVEEVCQEAGTLGLDASEVAAVIDFIKYRRDNIKTIIANHKDQFRGIRQWDLGL